MAGTSTTVSFDQRDQDIIRFPVWEKVITYTFSSTATAAEVKEDLEINGILQKIIAYSGAATGITGTFTLAIDDNGDNEIFSESGPAELGTSIWDVDEPLSGTIDIGVNPSDDPTSGSWTITITLRGI